MVVVGFVIIIVVILLLAFLGYLIYISIKSAGKNKLDRKKRGITAQSALQHVEGLPLSDKTMCKVSATEGGILVEGGGSEFTINSSQLRAVEVKTDVEISNIVHSSAVQGVVGGLVFGPIGLVVGARAKNKQVKKNEHFLIINYVSSKNEIEALLFSAGENPLAALKIAAKTKPMVSLQPRTTVQL
ncbi:hypothetical protein M3629_03860 [Paenibacillus polysaccharolyticus]|uniref:hypothetical protein n=1 Tax=Paenibacillus polysaccharolyticus TaxID=582692 RepID=UPI0020409CF6|nr:hypothetical protein [Paenibacillus polysaccharolyticus]MCM3131904.1 hypothetical protein [Paenibacillus polysaccharolyticus]